MPGPWPTLDACLLDPVLSKRYDEATRVRVCSTLQRRHRGDSGEDAARTDDVQQRGLKVTEGETYAIIHDAIAAREGVNGRGEFKPWPELKLAVDTLEGVPLTYGHPRDSLGYIDVDVDPVQAVGLAINARAREDDRTLRYDALVYLKPADGVRIDDAVLQQNRALVEYVKRGGVVDNSGGYHTREVPAVGDHDGQPYVAIQHRIRFGHVAILKPFTPNRGACTAPACGIGLDDEHGAGGCNGGDECCTKRLEASLNDIQQALGVSRATALAMVATSSKR